MDHTKLLKDLFEYTAGFNFSHYEDFLSELCKTYEREQRLLPIEKNEKAAIVQKTKIGRYKDNQGKNIDFLIFKLKDGRSIQKARHLQRNVISSYLKDYGVYNGVDHVIAVFFADGYADWRLSFVKQQFKLDPEKKKVINEFTPAKRFSFLIEKGSKNQTIRKQSLELLKASIKPNINEIEKIFSVEKVTKEFFDNYKELYNKLKEAFEADRVFDFIEQKYNQGDPHFIENFVKKLLGQIVFLYFLQKKGWMGVQKDQKRGEGDKQFLRTLYTQCVLKKKLFFNDYLEPLFYNTLNKERPGHRSDYFGSKIPYLNGGLFQPINDYNWDGVENTLLSSNTANDIFGEILDTFDTFNFTIYENDPLEQDVAVDPEMLGKIFENLLPENERKGKGAFYTPREIVHYMCKQSLIQYLVTETGIEEKWIENLMLIKDSLNNTKKIDEFGGDDIKKQIWKQNGLVINNALKEVKIVDPAVGSGAFPMGILKEIVDIRRYILTNIIPEKTLGGEKNHDLLYRLKKETLSHCIYGVDLDPGAVDIAKLRFWLSLVVDYEGDHIEPLPNLDYKIMQGNSLIENPIIGDQVIDLGLDQKIDKVSQKERKEIMRDNGLFEGMMESSALLKKLTILHSDYFKETSPDHKKRLKGEIHTLEQRLILQKAKETIDELNSEIQNNYHGALSPKKANELAGKYETINEIKRVTSKLTETGVKNYFPWRLHFGEIFRDHGGFDIIIGNPPYVGEKGNKEIFREVTKGSLKEFYMGKMDLFYFFFHLAINIGKDNSQIGFITTNYFVTADGALKLRKDFKERTIIRKLINLNELKIFKSAMGQHNMITFLQKGTEENSISLNCITARKGYYIDTDGGMVLDNILEGVDVQTHYYKVPQNDLYESSKFYMRINGAIGDTNNSIKKVLNKIAVHKNLLGNICNINIGMRTGADKVSDKYLQEYNLNSVSKGDGIYVLNNEELRNLNLNDYEMQYIVPFFKNSDIGKYSCKVKNDLWLINITYPSCKDIKLDSIPNIFRHLQKFQIILENRKSNDNGLQSVLKMGYWRAYTMRHLDFSQEKIVSSQRTKMNNFAINHVERYASMDVYFITSKEINIKIKYILGLLNSKLYYVRLYNKGKRKGETLELYQQPLSEIPIKLPNISEENDIILLVDKIINQKKDNPDTSTTNLEKELNQIIYKLYDLTDEETAIVEESVKR